MTVIIAMHELLLLDVVDEDFEICMGLVRRERDLKRVVGIAQQLVLHRLNRQRLIHHILAQLDSRGERTRIIISCRHHEFILAAA